MKTLKEILEEQDYEYNEYQKRYIQKLEEQLKEIIKVKIRTTRKIVAKLYPDYIHYEYGEFGYEISNFVRKLADADLQTYSIFQDRCARVGIKVSNLIPRTSKLPKFLRDWTHTLTVEF